MKLSRFMLAGTVAVGLFVLSISRLPGADDSRVREEAGRVKASLEQSLKTDPNNSELWIHMGFTDHKLGNVDNAQAAFEKARALNPKNPDALYMLGLIYEKKNMKAEALNSWKTLLDVSDEKWRRDTAAKHIHHLNSND